MTRRARALALVVVRCFPASCHADRFHSVDEIGIRADAPSGPLVLVRGAGLSVRVSVLSQPPLMFSRLSAIALSLSALSPFPPQLTFEAAAERVKTLKEKPANDTLLRLYGLYKQATVGDNTASQPWQVQMEARAKWEAWTAQKGKSQDAAKAEYVTLVESLAAADK